MEMASLNPDLSNILPQSREVELLETGPQHDHNLSDPSNLEFVTSHDVPNPPSKSETNETNSQRGETINLKDSKDLLSQGHQMLMDDSQRKNSHDLQSQHHQMFIDASQRKNSFSEKENSNVSTSSTSVSPIKEKKQMVLIKPESQETNSETKKNEEKKQEPPESPRSRKRRLNTEETNSETKQVEEKKQEPPESPRSRKRRLNTEKVRKYRQRKRAKMEAQLIAEGKPVTFKRQYKKRNSYIPPAVNIKLENNALPMQESQSKPDINMQAIVARHVAEKRQYATTDLCDAHISSPVRLQAAESGVLFDFGGMKSFHGQIQTVRCFESNPLVRKTLGEPGNNRVLIVDGGGSRRVAILGDQLATMAHENNWAGIIVNGCIRDSKVMSTIPVGVKALGTHPLKSLKNREGEKGGLVAFAGLEFQPGHWVYADEDGVIISENELSIDEKSP